MTTSPTDFEQKKWAAEKEFREREIALKEREQDQKEKATFDSEKWQQERDLRERELSLKERAQKVSEDDFQVRKEELARARWRSPLVVAIFAAAIAALGNAVVAFVNGREGQTLEDNRAESARILEMIKTGDADKAAENLRFLADAGLVADPNRLAAIRRFLANRSPGQGPSLPPSSSTSGLQPTRTLPQSDPLRPSTLAVGQLQVKNGDSQLAACTAFRVTENLVLTAGYCLSLQSGGDQKVFFAPISADGTAKESFEVALPPKEVIKLERGSSVAGPRLDAILLELKKPNSMSGGWLTLSSTPPSLGQPLGAVAFLSSSDQMIARDSGCQVTEVKDHEFSHHCSLGPGSGGAPILTADGRVVLGVEMWGSSGIEWAARADQLLAQSKVLQNLAPAPQK